MTGVVSINHRGGGGEGSTIGELLNSVAPVALKFADGRSQEWRLIRL